MTYETLLKSIVKKGVTIPERLLCIDPGETTGVSMFENGQPVYFNQLATIDKKGNLNWDILFKLFEETNPTHIVCENYRIYAHKLEQHSSSSVPTLRLIGGIDLICHQKNIPLKYQMAIQAKGFTTDDKLKAWGMWEKGMKHCRDSLRHGVYYFVSLKPDKK